MTDPVHPITAATPCGEPAQLPTGVLLDIGHAFPITFVARSKTRIFTMDAGGASTTDQVTRWRWNLWDPATAMQVGSGIADQSAIGFTPTVFAVPANGQVELRSTDDGQLRGTIPASDVRRFGLSFDGSYIWGASTTALSAWTLTGAPIFSRPGNYDGASIFAGADQIQVVWGPAGQNVIEQLALADGSQTATIAFKGNFTRWFLDGKHFTTLETGYTRLYDQAGVQLSVGLDTIEGGIGDIAWHHVGSSLELYRLGMGPNSPSLTFAQGQASNIAVSGNVLAITIERAVEIVHLDHAPLIAEVAHTPIMPSAPWIFGLDETGNWAAGDTTGQVYVRGTESDALAAEYLGCGLLHDVVGAPTGQVAAAIGDNIHALDATTGRYAGSHPVAAVKLALSDDGQTLIVNKRWIPEALPQFLDVLTWPDGVKVNAFQSYYPSAGKSGLSYGLFGWSFASSRGELALTLMGPDYWRLSTTLDGKLLLDDHIGALLRLSPNGKRLDVGITTDFGPCQPGGAQFFDGDGAFSGSTPLVAIGWLDDDKVLTQAWTGLHCADSGETRIYDALGNVVSTTSQLPKIGNMKPISGTQIYAADRNTVYDVTTGATLWSSPLPIDSVWQPAAESSAGAVAGNDIVFSSDSRLLVEAYR